MPPQFILISVITAADAIDHLAKHKTPDDSTSILVLSAVSIVVLTAMGIYKIYLNKCAPPPDIRQHTDSSSVRGMLSATRMVSGQSDSLIDNDGRSFFPGL